MLVCGLMLQTTIAGNPDAKRLYDDLLSNYNKLVRPVINTTDVLRVCIKLKLSQLIDVVSILFFINFSAAAFVFGEKWVFARNYAKFSPEAFLAWIQFIGF